MPKAPRDQLDLQSQSLVPIATARMGEKHRAEVSYQKRGRGDFPGHPGIAWQCRDTGSLPRTIKIPHAGAKLSQCAPRTEPASHNERVHMLRQKIPRSHMRRKTRVLQLQPDTAKQTEIQLRPDTAKQTNFFLKVNEFILFKEKKEDGLMSSSVINTLFSKIDLINTQDGAFPLWKCTHTVSLTVSTMGSSWKNLQTPPVHKE